MKKFFKQLLCNHGIKTPDNMVRFIDGQAEVTYRVRCMKCGKVWRSL